MLTYTVLFINFLKKYSFYILLLISFFVIFFFYNFYSIDFTNLTLIDNTIELATRKKTNLHENLSSVDVPNKEEKNEKEDHGKSFPIYGLIAVLIIYARVGDFTRYNWWGWTPTPLGNKILAIYLIWFFYSCFHEAGLI